MAEIVLGDLLAYCFIEAVRAREMTDAYSMGVARRYAQDPVLQQFPTPRFTIPRLDLTIPVLISDAKLAQAARFTLERDRFTRLLLRRAALARRTVEREHRRPVRDDERVDPSPDSRAGRAVAALYEDLVDNPEPLRSEQLVRAGWAEVFERTIAEVDLPLEVRESDVTRRVLAQSSQEVVDLVRENTVLERAAVQQLLVDPLTQRVRGEGSQLSVFSVQAQLFEEGFFLHSVRDDDTGEERPLVDFE